MKTEQRKQSFTRAEVVSALAGVYAAEQAAHHELAVRTQKAAQDGEAAEYSRLDEAARVQQERLSAMMSMVFALGIGQTEFMEAVGWCGDAEL